MEPRKVGRPKFWTQEKIIAALKRFERENGRQPSAHKSREFRYLPPNAAVQREFGSWNNAIAAAGMTPRPPSRTPVAPPHPTGSDIAREARILNAIDELREKIDALTTRVDFAMDMLDLEAGENPPPANGRGFFSRMFG